VKLLRHYLYVQQQYLLMRLVLYANLQSWQMLPNWR